MRRSASGLLLFVLLLAALPGTVSGATPAPWPSAADVRSKEPGVGPGNAVCMAAFLHGRLPRSAWMAPYRSRTPAQKLTTDLAHHGCMTREERVAMVEHDYTKTFGEHAELQCVARRVEARSRAMRLAIRTRLQEYRYYDPVFRACGFMGVLYARYGRQLHLQLTDGEKACVNRIGSVIPLYPLPSGDHPSKADRVRVGTVYDRCVGLRSKTAMWRSVFHAMHPAASLPCVAQQLAAGATFVMLFADRAAMDRVWKQVRTACAPASVR